MIEIPAWITYGAITIGMGLFIVVIVVQLVDLVHHPVGTAACRVKSGKFALEGPADKVGIVDQCAEHELDDRGGRAFGQSPQLALGGSGDSELVGSVVVGHFAAKRARSSSPVM